MGNPIQIINAKTRFIASDSTWIEGKAIEQLKKTATLTGMHRVVGMPDLHPGRGYPIGAAFLTKGKVYPALVGNDIGCGMSLYQTDIQLAKLNLDKLEKRLNGLDAPLDEGWHTDIQQGKQDKDIHTSTYDQSLGTIGGGNHFAEFQKVEAIVDEAACAFLGIQKKQLLFLAHSGSRGLGQQILARHIRAHNHDGLDIDSEDFQDYIAEHDEAVRWAELNRSLIAARFLKAVRAKATCVLDINHNLVSPIQLDGESCWLHRKGATPADEGYVVIPGSRGDFTYLVQPIPDAETLFSLAHGAGRKWIRSDCMDKLKGKYQQNDLYRTKLGSRVICKNKALLYEEAPEAYKSCDRVIDDLCQAGLIRIVAKLRPVLTYKTQGGCHE